MKITEKRLRQLIRNVIKENLDLIGDAKTITIPFSENRKEAFNKAVIDYCMHDLSQVMEYVEPPRDYYDCDPHECFSACMRLDPYNRDEFSRYERAHAFEGSHKFTVTSHSHSHDEGGKAWEFRCEVEGHPCGFRVTAQGLPIFWECESI